MLKNVFAVLSALIIFNSCKKDNDQGAPPPPVQPFDVITTASIFNPSTGNYEAVYWLNEKRNALESGGVDQAFAYGIEKQGSDIYIAGSFANTKGSDDRLKPCYWKNGKKIDLTDGVDIQARSSASDLKWFNNALYISGETDLDPMLWKIKNGMLESITRFGVAGNILAVRKAGNMQLYGGKLYIGGSQKKNVNGNIVYTIGYWVVDENDQPSFTVLHDNLPYALGFSMSVSDKGVFIMGEGGTAQHPVPTIWTKTGQHPVNQSFEANYHRLHTGVPDSKGNLLLNVLDIRLYQPVIWKVSATGTHQLIKPAVPAGAQGFCESLDVKDDKLAYVYSYDKDQKSYAAYVFNGKTVELDIYKTRLSNINSIKLVSR
ncbi:hypothetical protein LZZ85_15225 [Terrimonas sp. NA20]|uniref:DUF4374 domain-containing protein n=1 Tax=Terrimonas ginsenosidimutans TaxID=2908004 RepID=A0ABS9KTJ4_9BACT|nr:hypothetical protein [Terrimonas ginsenosidimutans]MCG2615651.1 hypothetical protein [Terrimonas ginsenosidimutans]